MYVIEAASNMWQFWRNGLLSVLLMIGSSGYLLIAYSAVALVCGPFACIQLWRRRRSGKATSIIVVACALALDVALFLVADVGSLVPRLPSMTVKIAVLLLLIFTLRAQSQGMSNAETA